MSCCGQKRAAWRAPQPAVVPAAPVPRHPVTLAHRGEASTLERGVGTGLTYLFGPRGSTLEVDAADVEGLLATQRFERW